MMNVIAVWLVLSSLVTAGVLSPNPQVQNQPEEEVIVKEGHRVVIVEYEKHRNGNTKVSIAPHEASHKPPTQNMDDKTYISTAKDKLSSAASTAEDAVEDAKDKVKETSSVHGPRELVCDALGKCKQKIASALGKAKEKVSGKAEEVEEHAKEAFSNTIGKAKETVAHAAEHAKEDVSNTIGKANDTVAQKAEHAKEAVSETIGKAKETVARKAGDKVQEAQEQAKDAIGRAKDTVAQKTGEMSSKAREVEERAKDTVRDASQKAKESVFEKARRVEEEAKAGAKRLEERGEKGMKEVAAAVDSVLDVVHLLGFATAYGMCMWVTFVSSYVLAGALTRQQFGLVQSKIYPVYFTAMAYCVGVVLAGHLLTQRTRLFSHPAEMLQGFHLLVSLMLILLNSLYLEPLATKVMFERMKLEKEEGRGMVDPVADTAATPEGHTGTSSTLPATPEKPDDQEEVKSRLVELSVALKKLNAYSSYLNILTLMALTWHLVYLAQHLHLSC
ncbi:late embryogenesis abundant protein (LEA) family protein [Actinidia rufa]|uniref:Late embryogenesis abundant protein (LEA) family protein n=1 Tax=Actinidia rufa TaxID=165716 RepID=A0A7J0GG75_9ERIC|nr:late embryogenesis abundant protein (LEA) family protein [Actinidia rufa]